MNPALRSLALASFAATLAACSTSKDGGGSGETPPLDTTAAPPSPAPPPPASPPSVRPEVWWTPGSGVSTTEDNKDTTLTFAVMLTPSPSSGVTVDWATESDTATPDADYRAARGTLTFASSSDPQMAMVNVSIIGDTVAEADETFRLVLSNPQGGDASIRTSRVDVLIRNDDASFSMNSPRTREQGSGDTGELRFVIGLSHPVAIPVVVDYALAPDSTAAVNDNDFEPLPGSKLTFEANEMEKSLSVVVNGDDNIEDDETVIVEFRPRRTQVPFRGTGVIEDDDRYRISIDSPSVVEGPPGVTTNLVFTVTVRPEPRGLVTVQHALGSGSATKGYDYQDIPDRTIPFRRNHPTQMIIVPVFGDGAAEPDETVTIVLSGATAGAVIESGGGSGTIIDDDTKAKGTRRAFTGFSTNVVHVDTAADPQTAPGRQLLHLTAVDAAVRNYDWNGDGSLDGGGLPTASAGEIRQAIAQATGTDIAAITFGTGILPGPGESTWSEEMESRGGATFIVMESNAAALSRAAGEADNGIVAFATDEDRVASHACGSVPPPNFDCINVNMRRGASPNAPVDHSLAASKLAGYAALLHQAFEPASGEDLVDIILAGANASNVFSFAKALQREGLPSIGNGKRYANVEEYSSGARGIETGFAIVNALAGRTGAIHLRSPGKPLGLAAFRTLDNAALSGSPAAQGFAFGFKTLRWGAVFERDRFLGRTRARMLGSGNGHWTWFGWSDGASLGAWRLAADLEMGVGTADAGGSPVVADYGRLYATAWTLRADYRSMHWRLAATARQPARTERARIRLRNDEGVVRESPGREVRFGLKLDIGHWAFDLARTIDPGHDERAGPTDSARFRYAYSW